MKRFLFIVAAAILVATFSTTVASSYPAFFIGRKTLAGCDWDKGNTCCIKVDLPGPPEMPEFRGVVEIDYSTAISLGPSLQVALPLDPLQFNEEYGVVVQSIWYTTDGSPCPMPTNR
jgi:hypothetical protein